MRGRKEVSLKIPPLIRDGQTMRLRGLGEPGSDGGDPGDLYLTITITGDDVYRVDGADIEADLPLAPWEAALGTKVPVRTPEGRILLTVPPETRSGARLRIRGHGLARPDGTRGDFFARVRVDLPYPLGEEEQDLLRRLSSASPRRVTGGARTEETS